MNLQEFLDSLGLRWNGQPLSLEAILQVLLLALVGIVVIRILMKLTDRMLARSKALAPLGTYIRTAIRIGLWFLLILMLAEAVGIHTASFIALLSVVGLAVSLALQNTLSNVAGGMLLLVARPFQVGDYVEADGVGGTVSSIGLSYTTFTTIDNKEIFVPNSQVSAAKITNYTAREKRRVEVNVLVSYETPTQAVKGAIQQALDVLPQRLADPPPEIRLAEFKESSIRYMIRVWTATDDYWPAYFALLEGVRESFARNGVKMTYNHLNVHLLDEEKGIPL